MKKLLIFLQLTLSYSPLFSQSVIHGFVRDDAGLPLTGANIFIPELNKGTISGEKGYYELTGLPEGKLAIKFSFVGFTDRIESVNLGGAAVNLDVNLEAKSIQGQEIVITGGYSTSQHENVVKIDAIDINPLDHTPAPSFAAIITRTPGVSIISKGSGISKPVIRGLSMNDILVLNNGVKFENYQFSDHHPMGITEFGIEDIEIIKGPASLLYGSDAIGGVINFIRERSAPAGTFRADYNTRLFTNSLGYVNNIGFKGSTKKFSGGIRLGQKSHADFLEGGGRFVPNSRFREHSLKLNAGHSGQTGNFRLFYDYTLENIGIPEQAALPLISGRGRTLNDYFQNFKTHLLSSQNRIYVRKLKLDINSALQNTELTHFARDREYEIQMKLQTLTWEAKLLIPSKSGFEYITGYQGMSQKNVNLHNRRVLLIPDATIVNNSFFFMAQKTFFSRLKGQAGIRYDNKMLETEEFGDPDLPSYRKPVENTYGNISGSAGTTLHLSEKLQLRTNLATGFRTPNIAELSSNGEHEARFEIGDPGLKPEKSFEADISAHYHITNITLDMAVFYNSIHDYIFITPTGELASNDVRIFRYLQEDSELYGGEAGIHYHPQKARWMHVMSAFSTVKGVRKGGVYLPFIPADKIHLEIRTERIRPWFLNKAFVMLSSDFVFRQDHPGPEEKPTGKYGILNISSGGQIKLFGSFADIVLGLSNVLDVRYIDHLSTLKEINYYNPGRDISLTLRIPFESKL